MKPESVTQDRWATALTCGAGARTDEAADPGQELGPVLEVEEAQHQGEQAGQQQRAGRRRTAEHALRDVLRVRLQLADDVLDGGADPLLAQVERRAGQPLLELAQTSGHLVGDLLRLTRHLRCEAAQDAEQHEQRHEQHADRRQRVRHAPAAQEAHPGHSTVASSRASRIGSRTTQSLLVT
jgi:hypothetical protein